MGRECG